VIRKISLYTERNLKDTGSRCPFFCVFQNSFHTALRTIQELFRESYGIWNDLRDPVEEVVLHYDSLDGAFIKTLPLHETQEILSDDPENGLTIGLRLRITNDFVMELLSRSRSLEVLKPLHLRERVRKIYETALERNK
jgi:hypothetical protein